MLDEAVRFAWSEFELVKADDSVTICHATAPTSDVAVFQSSYDVFRFAFSRHVPESSLSGAPAVIDALRNDAFFAPPQ